MKKQSLIKRTRGRKKTPATTLRHNWNLAATWLEVGALLFLAGNAGAVGFRLPNQDPEAIARGNAFVATADNPSAIYYNPAGITQLEGQNLSVGLYLISAGTKYEGANGAVRADGGFQGVPQLYYVVSPTNMPLSFGVGVYAPYGLAMDYGNSGPFRNVAESGSLLYASVNPVMAWKITPELSLGAGATINYSRVDFNQGIAPLDPFHGQFHFVGDDYNFGFNAGVRYQPSKYVSFGLNYQYAGTMTYKGHASSIAPGLLPNQSSPATAAIRFPQYIVGGISYRPTEKWNIEFDLDWTDWQGTKQATFNGTVLGTPIPNLPFHYRNSFLYELGVTRYLDDGYFLSAGYFYSEHSTPDADYNPLIPDSDLHLFSVGAGHHGDRWGWAVSYTLAVQPARNVSGSVFNNSSVPGSTVDGTYRMLNNAINASLSLKF